jgi:hypothetical protein
LVPDWYLIGTRLVPDWYQTGTRLVPDWYQAWYQVGTRLVNGSQYGSSLARHPQNVPNMTAFGPPEVLVLAGGCGIGGRPGAYLLRGLEGAAPPGIKVICLPLQHRSQSCEGCGKGAGAQDGGRTQSYHPGAGLPVQVAC